MKRYAKLIVRSRCFLEKCVILSASLFGAPISTTQVISSSVLGVGSSKRFSAVRWGVAGNMVMAWFVTIPASALIGALVMFLFRLAGLA